MPLTPVLVTYSGLHTFKNRIKKIVKSEKSFVINFIKGRNISLAFIQEVSKLVSSRKHVRLKQDKELRKMRV